jgi:phosphoglycolate phosphatase
MKLALFDVDGTLVDSRAMITASLTTALTSEGLAVPPQKTLLSIVGLSLADAMRVLSLESDEARIARLAATYKEAFWQYRATGEHAEDLFEGARGLLEELRARDDVVLGIATGKSKRGIAHLLAAKGMDGWFATIQTSDDHPSKPHPSMVIQSLSETHSKSSETIMIGDTSFDMEMARAGGVKAIGVTWGNHHADELVKAGAQLLVNDFNELRAGLELLWQEDAP